MHGTPGLVVEILIRIAVLAVAGCLIWYCYINYLRGFGSLRLPSNTPIAAPYASVPLCALFTIEPWVTGMRNGFAHPEPPLDEDASIAPIEANQQTRVGL